ncbi:hypothetical protein APR41_02085 [Salegentibacter salinarum]|uniref:Uncharacterized protein n=1 Tax=Salegentibacter salinarum TaxID=447422 RepID=A0A2N0U438_9FLAO|nr:DUF5695 domain-containing protein [Salegentibacter salinarum]PKD21791.1 hypothetical protein APR41_02085 [Salegentibacter salinarum]SKB33551.1 hypothetical protein SAMN05660903_00143 [Salegentibacter salinarum]
MKIKKAKILLFLLFIGATGIAQEKSTYWDNIKDRESTLGLEDGFIELKTEEFTLKLVKASQTIAKLSPNSDPDFDFTPGERIETRDKDSIYYIGDLNFRIKDKDGKYTSFSTAYNRKKVKALPASGTVLAASDLSNTLPEDNPLEIKRYYEEKDGSLLMRFEITNPASTPIEIGALGVPMAFNNILEGKNLDETHADNVFFDPYIGMDAGYLEVKHLTGEDEALLVLPGENMPFEAYRPLLDDPSNRSIVFEGVHEWMALSKAYAENEWKGVEQWNQPTSLTLKAGETQDFSLKFVLAPGIEQIQDKLIEEGRPVAVGIPGYVLPMDVEAKLFLNYPEAVEDIKIEPEGAIEIVEAERKPGGFTAYNVQGKKWGSARAIITYKDGLKQSINYKVIKPESEVVDDFGNFLMTQQWFDQPDTLFGRTNSVISYDYETKKQLTQDSRAWVAGLSDEGGAGSWLGAIMKQLIQPEKEEIKKLQKFIDETMWGGIQYSEGELKYGVKKSIFYYEPEKMPEGTYSDTINYNTWAAWNKKGADDPGRSYNYPHVAAAHWVMYRLARYQKNLVDNHNWKWYLENAYHTAVAMNRLAPHYAQYGQMEGTVFLMILKDLQEEGLTDLARDLEAEMKKRADVWKSLNYPFGSEMPWDSTGQEEVYMWSDYFGYDQKADITLNAILAYMPTMPHWAYNGNARRYWDFLYGGKLSRVERQIHHYGSGLNAIPVLKAYRDNPDFYLLKVGYAGTLGAIANITQDGFGPAAFHSYPSTLRIDYHSGDYGSGFFGYAINSATYITKEENYGWLAFGGNLRNKNNEVEVELTTAAKNKVFIASENLWLTLDAGKIEKVTYNEKNKEVKLQLREKDKFTPIAYLRSNKELELEFKKIRGAYQIELGSKKKEITIKL